MKSKKEYIERERKMSDNIEQNITIKELVTKTEVASTDFEKNNTELKRKYLVWNIEAFNCIALAVSANKGSFGTGYPFYALDKDLKGDLPIIQEQIRYNRELVRDGEPFQKSIWLCESCLKTKYSEMPDLKKICKPCPNMNDKLKPRKIINRLPDLDMWLVCEDGCVEKAQEELSILLEKYKMNTSDVNPISSLEDVSQISKSLKRGILPKIFLPIDAHIIEYSKLKGLIEKVPETLNTAIQNEIKPYLPIHPKSYRKQWQYDDEAYKYFSQSATMDLEDMHNNFYAGIHAANMAGAWQGIVFGFAGVRSNRGYLEINPKIPNQWNSYEFNIQYKGSDLSIKITKEDVTYQLLNDVEISFESLGESLTLKKGEKYVQKIS